MMRNDLIIQLTSGKDNEAVVVDVNGVHIDVDAVTVTRDTIVIVLNPEDVTDVLRKVASGKMLVHGPNTQ